MTEAQAKRLGELLARHREKQQLSLRTLADRADVDFAWLGRMEQGRYAQPAPERLVRLAEALDIDPVQIDRVSGNYMADSLPSVRTYFRSKEKATPEEIAEIEAAIRRIHKKHERRDQ